MGLEASDRLRRLASSYDFILRNLVRDVLELARDESARRELRVHAYETVAHLDGMVRGLDGKPIVADGILKEIKQSLELN